MCCDVAPIDHARSCSPTAARSFGKFSDGFLSELREEIRTHEGGAGTANGDESIDMKAATSAIKIHDSEVLAPEAPRRGGLMTPGEVGVPRISTLYACSLIIRLTIPSSVPPP